MVAGAVPATVRVLTEGALRAMFLTKMKVAAVVLMASGIAVTGAFAVSQGRAGQAQAPTEKSPDAGKQQPGAGANPEGKPSAPAPPGSDSPELEAIGKARIEVATKMRDLVQRQYEQGTVDLLEYLAALKRYDEVVADVMVKTAADRVRYLERQVATLKKIEEVIQARFRAGNTTQYDLLAAELARLDAEYALAKARADARSRSK